MWDAALQIAFAHLAASLIPGQSLALISTGIAASGVSGGLRAVAGITAGKVLWAAGTLAVLPLVLSADASVFWGVQFLGGCVLALVGLGKLLRSRKPRAAGGNILCRSIAGTLINPTTCVFFLAAFPLLVGAVPSQPPSFGLLCIAAIAATTAVAMVPWFAIGIVARRLNPAVLHTASGVILLLVGASLVARTLT